MTVLATAIVTTIQHTAVRNQLSSSISITIGSSGSFYVLIIYPQQIQQFYQHMFDLKPELIGN